MVMDSRFWKMIRKYWKIGVFEIYRGITKRSFVKALRVLVPDIGEDDLEEGPSGVRAQCINEDGALVDDFKIIEGWQAIHVLNVPSPAATASLAISDYIINLAERVFVLNLQEVSRGTNN